MLYGSALQLASNGCMCDLSLSSLILVAVRSACRVFLSTGSCGIVRGISVSAHFFRSSAARSDVRLCGGKLSPTSAYDGECHLSRMAVMRLKLNVDYDCEEMDEENRSVIRYASSRKAAIGGPDHHPKNQWGFAHYTQPAPTASSSPTHPETIGTLAAGHFALSGQKTASSHKRMRTRYSDAGSRGSEVVRSVSARYVTSGDDIPPSFNRYWDLTRARHLAVQKAADAVRVAYESAYGDQIELWSHFMVAAVRDGQIPHQPQATPARMTELTGKTVEDDVGRLVRFATLLPGFLDLDAQAQAVLLSTKYLISAMLHRVKFTYRGEMYTYLAGPEKIQNGTYCLQTLQVDPEFVRFVFRFAESFNDVGLTLTETYMLVAVGIFVPDHTQVSDRDMLGHLHAFYLDALFYMLGSRLSIADRAQAYGKVEEIMKQFPMIDKISLNFISNLDLNWTPLRARSVTFLDSLRM